MGGNIKSLIGIIERNPRATIFFSSSQHTFVQIVDELGDDVETSSSITNTIVMKNGCTVLATTNDYISSFNNNTSSEEYVPARGLLSSIYIERFEEQIPYWNIEYHDEFDPYYEW